MLQDNELETRVENLENIVELNHQELKHSLSLANYARIKNVKDLRAGQKSIESKVDNLENRFDKLENKVDNLENKFDSMFEYMKSKDEKVDLLVEHLQSTLKK